MIRIFGIKKITIIFILNTLKTQLIVENYHQNYVNYFTQNLKYQSMYVTCIIHRAGCTCTNKINLE